MRNAALATFERTWGIHIMGAVGNEPQLLAADAQPSLITTPNSGVPIYLTTYVDPKVIKILQSPMKAAMIAGGEIKKGDRTTKVLSFPVVEATGEVSSYGDYSNNGVSGANVNWVERQPYTYQTFTQWGELELEQMGEARIDWANQLSYASVLTLNKYQNKTYFFGVEGLRLYGLLNDPNLPAPIAPLNVGGNVTWATKDALGVYGDILALVQHIIAGANGVIDMETAFVLVMDPTTQVNLGKATEFNVNVFTLLKTNFPNMRIETAPEYATEAGNLVQIIVEELEGQRTVDMAFTEKLRAHPVIVEPSAFKQKKSQGTVGAIIYRPFLINAMLGV